MPYTTYNCDALQGGAARALDSYGVATLTTGDRAIVALSGTVYYFVYDSTATAAETVAAHPYVIRPDDYSTEGNWEEYEPVGGGDLVDDTTPQLGGALDPNSNYIGRVKGGDIASASPLVIDTDGDYFDVTGTTGFAAMTVVANRLFVLQFDGILTMTHHATNLDLPGEANITTAAGDVATFQSTGVNTVQCVSYTRADGTIPTPVNIVIPDAGNIGSTSDTDAITISAAGEVTMNAQPAFQAQADGNQTNITNTTETDLLFPTESFDVGGNYASPTFTAPVTGKYQISYQLKLDQIDFGATYSRPYIESSNRIYYSYLYPIHFTADGICAFEMSLLIDMDANDTVKIRFYQSGGASQVDLAVLSTFSGVLIC